MSEPTSETEGEIITTYELLERSARAALDLQRGDGSFPPGRNGIYDEPETPVRTTSHWLTTLSKVYEITGDEEFAEAANDAADYLLSEEARPHGYTFHSRNVEGKDKCDGLVGQAAPIRGLAWASSALNRSELGSVAKDVFSIHPFDERLGLWERIEIEGSNHSFDRTLNHQILFAGAAAHLAHRFPSVEKTVLRFVDRLASNVALRSDGIIQHYIRPPLGPTIQAVRENPRRWKLLLNLILSRIYTVSSQRKRKEIGYHPINLLGLAHIQANLDTPLLQQNDEHDLIERITSPDTLSYISGGNFRYGGMTPGIDVGFALQEFQGAGPDEIRQWIEMDLKHKYDPDSGKLSNGADDPILQAATVSYLVDLEKQEFNI
ncbi:hypothetical protein [Halorubrum sp. DTA98]|uniref:hypothetical protein n=1 Tax=Halorubrum sp. DTA98 TaxID=3402163 RepID=UPI003AAB38FF